MIREKIVARFFPFLVAMTVAMSVLATIVQIAIFAVLGSKH